MQICPNCNNPMKEDIYHYGYCENSICKKCKITYYNWEWGIPKRYMPTEKQIKTIYFINNRLDMDLKPLTKNQCIRDIGMYFKKAKFEKESIMDYELKNSQNDDILDYCEQCF